MDIKVSQDFTFGMKAIASLKQYARKHPEKRIKIDPEKMKKANESIQKALKDAKKERLEAEKSASQILLNV
jgi:F0F1-type ATP synthase membrane subunit b/b'